MLTDRDGSRPEVAQGMTSFPLQLYVAAALEADAVLRRGTWASGRDLELDDLEMIAETLALIRLELGLPA
jgi:hypothetical protein